MKGLGDVVLLEEVCHWSLALRFSEAQARSSLSLSVSLSLCLSVSLSLLLLPPEDLNGELSAPSPASTMSAHASCHHASCHVPVKCSYKSRLRHGVSLQQENTDEDTRLMEKPLMESARQASYCNRHVR